MKIGTAEFLRTAVARKQFVRDDLPQVAFCGRSNVGKSSLINKLLQRKGLARTSSKPGRTRAVNYFLIDRRWYCVDLPGYGYARASRTERESWGRMVDDYLNSVQGALGLVLLVDGKVRGTPTDQQAAEYLGSFGVPLVVAVTKMDKVPRSQHSKCLREVAERLEVGPDVPLLPVSALKGTGIPDLWSVLEPILAPQRTV